MPITRETVESALSGLLDPETGRSVLQMEQVHDVRVNGNRVDVTLGLTTWSKLLWEENRQEAERLLHDRLTPSADVHVRVEEHTRLPERIGEIGLAAKSVIAVGSGKGGVGKSTIAASLAYGLKNSGASVGLMDADVYGPSIPHLLGVNDRPYLENNRLQPVVKDGLRVMSMGFLVPPGEAVVWRGPMLHGAITQFLRDTDWGPLDYLIIDMPPGTGDIALTLSQLLPLTGAVVVCTPQDVALLDAVKAIAMFRKVHIPMLGMVENMSYFICPDCGRRYDIFGSGGARRRAAELDVPFLGEVPINIGIRQRGDAGETAANYNDEATASFFRDICYRLLRQISTSHKAEPPLP
ncbi:MAG TPA: Mrp/NBP35 family ATP-binding protein, partial [Lacipirellulaceae bacterium]|nr:Mrp/NBP35 family ATP-binding protein [Lacipirellulaceae bacterium]